MNLHNYIVLPMLLCAVSFANGADATGSERCSSIQEASKRLQCFDLATKNPPAKAQIASTEAYARKAVLKNLKDPGSAKFGKFTQVTPTTACLTVNARNAFGGYTGDQQALLLKAENQWLVADINKDLSHAQCIEAVSKE